jgi:CRP/FNR family transcriptional regulator
LLRIDVERFEDLRGRHADLAWAAAEQLARHLDDVVNGMLLSALGSVRLRVIYHLLALSAPASGGGCRTCRVTRQQLADSVGSVREVVTRVLSELRRERLITGQDRMFIQDPERLRDEVEDLLGRRPDAWAELRSRSA